MTSMNTIVRHKRNRTYSCPAPVIPGQLERIKKQQEAREEEFDQDRAIVEIIRRKNNEEKKKITSKKPQIGTFSLDLNVVMNNKETEESLAARAGSMSARDILITRQKSALNPIVKKKASEITGSQTSRT